MYEMEANEGNLFSLISMLVPGQPRGYLAGFARIKMSGSEPKIVNFPNFWSRYIAFIE